VPDEVYLVQRPKVLQKLTSGETIFKTEYFRALCEEQARKNVSWEIEYLSRI